MRSFIQRWAMRIKESRTILTVGMWGVITLSQLVQLFKPYLSFNQLLGLVVLCISGGIGFSFYYPEYIMKGEEKERQYKKGNFIDPRTYIYQQIDVAQMAVQSKAIAQDWSIEKTTRELEKVTEERVNKFFDGVNLSDFKEG